MGNLFSFLLPSSATYNSGYKYRMYEEETETVPLPDRGLRCLDCEKYFHGGEIVKDGKCECCFLIKELSEKDLVEIEDIYSLEGERCARCEGKFCCYFPKISENVITEYGEKILIVSIQSYIECDKCHKKFHDGLYSPVDCDQNSIIICDGCDRTICYICSPTYHLVKSELTMQYYWCDKCYVRVFGN